MDIKAGIAAVAMTYPQGGVLFFDVSDPASPRFLSRYNATECDQLVAGHQLRRVRRPIGRRQDRLPVDPEAHAAADAAAEPQRAQPVRARRRCDRHRQPAQAGAAAVLCDRRARRGAHGALAHDPRGAVEREPPARRGRVRDLQPERRRDRHREGHEGRGQAHPDAPCASSARSTSLATIQNNEVHDTFIQNDPLDGRTYLYNAAGFATGFNVYDMTDPGAHPPGRRVGPHARVRGGLVRAHDRRHAPRRPPLRDDARRDAADDRQRLGQRPGRDVRRRQGRGLRLLRRQRRQARPAVDRRRDGLLQARPGERQEVARAGARDRRRAEEGLPGGARRDVDEPRRAARRLADVLAAQPADRRRQDLPLALPRRRLRARRVGRLLRQARAARRSWASSCPATSTRARCSASRR